MESQAAVSMLRVTRFAFEFRSRSQPTVAQAFSHPVRRFEPSKTLPVFAFISPSIATTTLGKGSARASLLSISAERSSAYRSLPSASGMPRSLSPISLRSTGSASSFTVLCVDLRTAMPSLYHCAYQTRDPACQDVQPAPQRLEASNHGGPSAFSRSFADELARPLG